MRRIQARERAIAFIIESLAHELLTRWGVSAPPVPVMDMLDQLPPPWQRVRLLRVPALPWNATYSRAPQRDFILVRQGLTAAQERAAVARELFQLLLSRLNGRGIWAGPLDRPGVWANHFGRCLLLPTEWLNGGGPLALTAVVRRFDVPRSMAAQRLRELGLTPTTQPPVS